MTKCIIHITAYMTISILECLKVSVSFSTNMTEPGQNLTLSASASPGSYMALLAVDQSVTLLGDMNDITHSQVWQKKGIATI